MEEGRGGGGGGWNPRLALLKWPSADEQQLTIGQQGSSCACQNGKLYHVYGVGKINLFTTMISM